MDDALKRMPLRPRTDADEQEEYDEDVEDGDDGQGDGGDDLAKGVEAAEEADHAEGPEGPDEARRLVGDGDGEEGHDHDEAVQPGPAPQPTPRVSETNFVRRPGGGLARRGCQQRFVINKANVYVWRGGWAPSVRDEGDEPVGKGVCEEFYGEEDGEGEVEGVEGVAEGGAASVGVD